MGVGGPYSAARQMSCTLCRARNRLTAKLGVELGVAPRNSSSPSPLGWLFHFSGWAPRASSLGQAGVSLCPHVVWRQAARRVCNAHRDRKATDGTALVHQDVPGPHSCPFSGVSAAPERVSQLGSCEPSPWRCPTPGPSTSEGLVFSQSQALTRPAPNPFSHLEGGMFFH